MTDKSAIEEINRYKAIPQSRVWMSALEGYRPFFCWGDCLTLAIPTDDCCPELIEPVYYCNMDEMAQTGWGAVQNIFTNNEIRYMCPACYQKYKDHEKYSVDWDKITTP